MNIRFNGKYKSLNNFEWDDIPNFVIITGLNGSGKTQLLELIYLTLTNPNFPSNLIIEDLNLQPKQVLYLSSEWGLQDPSTVNIESLLSINKQLYSQFKSFKQGNREAHLQQIFGDLITNLGKNKELITEEEFYTFFESQPRNLSLNEQQVFNEKIGEIFINYRLQRSDSKERNVSNEDFVVKYGKPPWETLDDILKASGLPFEFNNPGIAPLTRPFTLKIINSHTKEEVNFSHLSSGERVIISIVFWLYHAQENALFPRLLLLDEPTAHLHPSMTKQFLDTVYQVLVCKYGVRVIMTTHSPSTVALAPEESLFEMARDEPKIRKSTSLNKTISLLTAGLVTVGKGSKYILVEDEVDAKFYIETFQHLVNINKLNGDIPLVFIPAGNPKQGGGGKNEVRKWVSKLQISGLENIIQGIVDQDNEVQSSDGIHLYSGPNCQDTRSEI